MDALGRTAEEGRARLREAPTRRLESIGVGGTRMGQPATKWHPCDSGEGKSGK